MYTAREISEKLNMPYIKVYKRFISKYANERWGVEKVELRDGRFKMLLPSSKLKIWKDNNYYLGRPTTI